jgi:hypothetical protein
VSRPPRSGNGCHTLVAGHSKRAIALPARQPDRQIYSNSEQAYLPFTPLGFERGRFDAEARVPDGVGSGENHVPIPFPTDS